MKINRWFFAAVLTLFACHGGAVLANGQGQGAGPQGQGQGRAQGQTQGQGQERGKENDRVRQGGPGAKAAVTFSYGNSDRDFTRGWYRDNLSGLPPGLAKKDRLPPGLEKQLIARGTLPPGLRNKVYPVPSEFARRLTSPPPGYEHVFIGGHLVLLNRKTFLMLDVFPLF